jgi:hypothetical protein
MASRWPRLVPLLAFLYLPFIGGGLITDDFAHVVHLTGLDSTVRVVDAPDTFGFYRPATQASIAAELAVHGNPAAMRATNVLLHGACIALAFVVAQLVLGSAFGAGLAALAFALTPKAHPIAVLWISARGELLMALFSLASIAAWITWTRRGGWTWLVAAAAAYALALLSKETATLLPLLLLLTPRAERSVGSRLAAVAMLIAIAAVIYAWRTHSGALTPFSGDEHYNPTISATLWIRTAINYAGRVVVAPLALLVMLSVAALIDRRRSRLTSARAPAAGTYSILIDRDVIAFAAAFVVIFLAPVLPIRLRSELYLYLPVFGVCLLAGWLALLFQRMNPRFMAVAIALTILTVGGYQAVRSLAIHRDLVFADKLVSAIRSSTDLAGRSGHAIVIPADAETERFLQDSVGGYLYLVLQHALPRTRLTGDVEYRGNPPRQADVRLACAYQNGAAVVISRAP